jgi:hypothetical protein
LYIVLLDFIDFKACFFSAVILSGLNIITQIFASEKLTLKTNWMDQRLDEEICADEFNSYQINETEGEWSKSSSMSTINLKDQPITDQRTEYPITVFQLLINARVLASLYQLLIAATVTGALEV